MICKSQDCSCRQSLKEARESQPGFCLDMTSCFPNVKDFANHFPHNQIQSDSETVSSIACYFVNPLSAEAMLVQKHRTIVG